MVFASDCSEDILDKNWQRLILTHLREKEHVGVLTGSFLTDMKITVVSGRIFHVAFKVISHMLYHFLWVVALSVPAVGQA